MKALHGKAINLVSTELLQEWYDALLREPQRIHVEQIKRSIDDLDFFAYDIYIDGVLVSEMSPNSISQDVFAVQHNDATLVLALTYDCPDLVIRFHSAELNAPCFVLDKSEHYLEMDLRKTEGVVFTSSIAPDQDFADFHDYPEDLTLDAMDNDFDVGPIDDDLEDFAHAP